MIKNSFSATNSAFIAPDGKEYRNLEAQVEKNKDDITKIFDTNLLLSEFGIKVIDNVATEQELLLRYPPASYYGDFGNAVLVGTETPYDYYIWTREFPDEIDPENPVNGEWFNIGQFPLPGPEGPQGPTGQPGSRGQRGNKWYVGNGRPGASAVDRTIGDLYLDKDNGNVYRYQSDVAGWVLTTNLKGAQGNPGPAGPTGPAGPIVDLIGTLTSSTQLPTVSAVLEQYGRQAAYLVGPEGQTKEVWGLTGPDDNLTWTALGLFAAGTQVMIEGLPVESIEMSNYVPFVAGTSSAQVMIYDRNNNEFKNTSVSIDPTNYSIPMRSSNGTLKAKDPVADDDAATKKYVDEKVASAGGATNLYSHPFVITWREWVEDPDTGEGYDETYSNEPFYIKLTPGMDFYLDVAFESYITSSVCPYYKSGNNWYPIWEDNNTINSLTAQKTYHFTVSQLDEDGSLVLRTEITYKDEYGQTGVVVNGYDLIGQFSYGYNVINLKIGLDPDSYADMYNTIMYTGNTQPTFGHDPIP